MSTDRDLLAIAARAVGRPHAILAVHGGASASTLRSLVGSAGGGGRIDATVDHYRWSTERVGVVFDRPRAMVVPWGDLHAVLAAGCTATDAEALTVAYRRYVDATDPYPPNVRPSDLTEEERAQWRAEWSAAHRALSALAAGCVERGLEADEYQPALFGEAV